MAPSDGPPPSGLPLEHPAWAVIDWRRRIADVYRTVRSENQPAQAHRVWAAERLQLLRTHPASPVPPEERRAFGGGEVAPYDPAFRFVVPVSEASPQRRELATGTDGVVVLERLGLLDLPGVGTLDLWWLTSYAGGLFLPLRDRTSGTSTYGGGRYVLDTVKGADLGGTRRELVVDLNFAYQPSCAYDPAWACPLPGPGNTLASPVPVGEQHRPEP